MTVSLPRPHHNRFLNWLGDPKHQLVSIHTYYQFLAKAFNSESKFLPTEESVDTSSWS